MKYIFITLLTAGLFAACQQDSYTLPEATPEFLLGASDYKKWEMIDPNVPLAIGTPTATTTPACSASEVKNGLGFFYNFYLNGKVEWQDGCGKAATDKSIVSGTWAFGADKKTITVSLTGLAPQTWTVRELTPSRLTVTNDGQDLTFAPTPLRN